MTWDNILGLVENLIPDCILSYPILDIVIADGMCIYIYSILRGRIKGQKCTLISIKHC